MASKRRLRRRSCESKRRYLSLEEALKVARHHNRATPLFSKLLNNNNLDAYHCKNCGGFHIGHGINKAKPSGRCFGGFRRKSRH